MAFQSVKSSKKRKSFLKKRLWKKQRRAFKLLLLKWGLAFLALFMAGLFAVSLVSSIIESVTQTQMRKTSLFNLTGSNLSPKVLAWQEEMSEEMARQGVDAKWLFVLLGIMQVESGGDASAHPDIMQASESRGLGSNAITDPLESIQAGVEAFKNCIESAKRFDIDDPKAIIFAYNTGGGFLSYLSSIGEKHWSIDIAEDYSRNVVFPAVTGRDPSQAQQTAYNTPFAQAVGKPYYYLNGGNFHYANAVYYAIGGEKALNSDELPSFSSSGEGNPDALDGSYGTSGPMTEPPAGIELPFGMPSTPGDNPYPYGQCTWYAYGRMQEIGKPLPWFSGDGGNGGNWGVSAAAAGYRVEQGNPAAGTAICFPPGVAWASAYGHIAVVEATFSDGSCLISESNVSGPGVIDFRTISAADVAQCSFIYA